MRDLSGESWLRSMWARDRLREFFWLHGYQTLEPPILEPTELFLRKSGGQLAAQMYTMTDPGGNLSSLRPEYTSSIVRHHVECGPEVTLPRRVQYCGPVFRYDEEGTGMRQYTQVGAELLGPSGPRADSEGVSLATGALEELGITDYELVIGDLSVHRGMLEAFGLSERAVVYVLEALTQLASGAEGLANVKHRAGQMALFDSGDENSGLPPGIMEMDEGEARELLQKLLLWANPERQVVGQRGAPEIVDRLLRRNREADDPVLLNKGLQAASLLSAVKGEPVQALEEAREVVRSVGGDGALLDPMAEVADLIEGMPGSRRHTILDFGLARGLGYYTGIIFELRDPHRGVSLGGGGRYDGLARALGSPVDVPALGFAYTLESLLDRLGGTPNGMGEAAAARGTYIWAGSPRAYSKALAVASKVRSDGAPAEIELCARTLDEGISFARERGYATVVTVDEDGHSTTYQLAES